MCRVRVFGGLAGDVYKRQTMFRDRLMTTGQAKTKGLHLFWTMVDGRERNDLYGIYEEVILNLKDLHLLKWKMTQKQPRP